ncbi:MAG TPA: PAS domain S-box protein [Verrucomicrobiae bacterium]|nr:PAS domain S-box protein [Verrucomicrobiae bacterium]
MTTPPRTSIKRKVMLVIMLASATVLLVTVAAFMVYDVVTFRQNLARNLDTQARMIGENCNAALIFKNETDAEGILVSLRTEPHIVAAALYDDQGKLFVKYPANIPDGDLPAAAQGRSQHFGKNQLTIFLPIVQSGTHLGTLYLKSDLTALSQRQHLYGAISLFIIAGSLLVALWLSNTLQRRISNPIVALANTARTISGKQDFSMRAQKTSDDELGDLTDAFNVMLAQVQSSHSALVESESQLSAIFNQAGAGIAQCDLSGHFLKVNDRYCEITGYRRESLIKGLTVQDITHPDDRPLNISALVEVNKGLPSSIIEKRYVRPDGEVVWARVSVVPLRDAAGDVEFALAVAQDITERKRQEVELASLMQQRDAQARLFDATLSSIADLAYTFDLEGNWIYANKPLLEIWGKSLEEITGKSSLELGYPPELAKHLKQQVKEVIRTGKPVKDETYFTDSKGVEDYHEYIFSPVFAADGSVSAVCGTTRLTTERKRNEIELKNARDQALAASRAKDDFLAALSHELRTPLNPVLLLASAAAEDAGLTPDIRAQFVTIRNNVELEARLIDDLLDLTRITRDKLSLEMHTLDVYAILRNAIDIIRSDLEKKHVRLTLDLAAGEPMMLGDAVRLQQIFWNVLKNAVKFTPDGGEIIVEAGLLPENGNIFIKVTDTGIGLTPGEIEHIFDAFSQGEHAITGSSHRFGGLGLGLTISHKLVELHAGIIRATSAGRNQGATFTLEFPQLPAVIKKDAPVAPEKAPARNLPAPEKPKPAMRILLVEDHEPTRVALAHLLARRKYKVSTAGSLAEARALVQREKFDLLVSDIGLPDGDGYTLMAELRDQFGMKGITLSGYGMEQDLAKGKDAGFIAHLIKPVRVESLEKVLNEIARD